MNRRKFLTRGGTAAMCLWVVSRSAGEEVTARGPDRPSILWLTCEDISPNLGCYGDTYAVTPNLDRLAAQGVRYNSAFAPIGVCAPSRSTLITGVYAPSLGTHHMRCEGRLPDYVKCFSDYLRQAGYYCTNNVKTDYNFKHAKSSWDECSARAHWRNRPKNRPFFAVFNYTQSHESQIRLPEQAYRERTRNFTPQERHDPARAPLPPYHPDTPEVRQDWARYYDMITVVDTEIASRLKELEQDGLADDTIVFFFSDHGAGMPRSKRWLYDSSLRVPLLVRFPPRYQHLAPGKPGSVVNRLVSFVDFGPTLLSLADVPVPQHMQGRPFLGRQAAEPRRYVYGFRDRMDDRIDMLRCVRDGRFKYIRNYMPHRPWFQYQHIDYMYEMPTMRVWQRLADENKLSGPAAAFMRMTRPPEELYDTQADPWEVNNLAGDPKYHDMLERMHAELRRWLTDIHDLGFLPEADLRTRFGDKPPYEAVRQDPAGYPQGRIMDAAELATWMDPANLARLLDILKDPDAAVRYWAVTGLLALGDKARSATDVLLKTMKDPSFSVRLAAAEALARLGRVDDALPVLVEGLKDKNEWVRLHAANILDWLGNNARPALEEMKRANRKSDQYVARVLTHALKELAR
jgi:N-sulfoglucosamine sulfohydrolase